MLTSLIKPTALVQLIRVQLEKHLEQEITSFSLMYNKLKGSVIFIIDEITYPYAEPESLISAIELQLARENVYVDAVKFDVNGDNEIMMTIYYTDNDGQKFKETKPLK